MKKTLTLLTGLLVLAGVFSNAPPAIADCPPPPGVTPPADPAVTAQQVEDGSATLMDFALAVRERSREYAQGHATTEEAVYIGCIIRQDDGIWRSGSTYIVSLTLDGRVYIHAKNMALSGRLLNPVIYGAILFALGVSPTDLANLASPDPATAAQAFAAVLGTLSQEPDGAFDATTPIPGLSPGIPGASGHAAVYVEPNLGNVPIVMLMGFDLNESHVVEEEIDYGDPTITAEEVVDRETLKAFVTQAGNYFLELLKTGDAAALSQARIALRDENGPWRHGSVYLYVLDIVSNIIIFHAAFPDKYEYRPLVPTVHDAVTGEFILPQVIEAAKSDPEGGFVEYYFDDPTDDTDSADIPKVGYAREFAASIQRADGSTVPADFIVGSGFYGRAPVVVPDGPYTVVEATVMGDAVEGLTVAFARSIAGQQPDYAYSAVTDANGSLSLTISNADGVSGYYTARASNADGETVGQWHSIPLNHNQRQVLELTLSGGMKIVRVEPLTASKPVAETEAAISGLAPNFPNPFNSATLITYHLSSPGPVQLVIYNVLGQPVRTLVDQSQAAGSYQIRWDVLDQRGVSLSTGIYIARLSYPGGVQTQRLLYLK
ncbi:MAG: T9SS type A sorting domain-containing protein [Gemmatimonadota bacterium]|nr:T9SS type A sorting domain-containing protein [Gemmatimonadota bacterium]